MENTKRLDITKQPSTSQQHNSYCYLLIILVPAYKRSFSKYNNKTVHKTYKWQKPVAILYLKWTWWKQSGSSCHEGLPPSNGPSSVSSHSNPELTHQRGVVQKVSDVCRLATSATAQLCHAVTHSM